MNSAELAILLVNVALALTFGIPLSRMFCRASLVRIDSHKALVLLLLVYLIEGLAFTASMATSVVNIALAIVWGALLGLRLRSKDFTRKAVLRLSGAFALYSSLPAMSVVTVPVACAVSGWSVGSVSAGRSFGIPDFVPWPANTILGFCVAVGFGTMVMKVGLTVGIARGLAFQRRGRSAAA